MPPGSHDRPVAVYTAHAGRLPPVRPYLRQLWARREFIFHLARTDLKGENYDTLFGQVWNVLNPLLLAGVYWVMLRLIRGDEGRTVEAMAVLIAAVFFFDYVRSSLQLGSRAIVGGQNLILNNAFPKALLPTSSVVSSVLLFVPSLLLYLVIHLALGMPVGPQLLVLVVLFAIVTVFNLGAVLFLSAATVQFRDVAGFLPYVLRLWLYVTPVLYLIREVPPGLERWLRFNPLYAVFAALQEIVLGSYPTAGQLLTGATWALASFLAGSLFFLLREREFALRV